MKMPGRMVATVFGTANRQQELKHALGSIRIQNRRTPLREEEIIVLRQALHDERNAQQQAMDITVNRLMNRLGLSDEPGA